MSGKASIVLQGVDKEYRRDEFRIPVLAGLDLTVDEGEFLAPWARPARAKRRS